MYKYRKGVFCVVYTSKPIKYLLLHRKKHWQGWEFPKGGKLAREKLENTVRREIKEETGLNVKKIKNFNVKGKFVYDKKTKEERKFKGFIWQLFACEVQRKKVKISKKEHDKYKWCTFTQAVKLLTWPNQKKCLEIVNKFLRKTKVNKSE